VTERRTTTMPGGDPGRLFLSMLAMTPDGGAVTKVLTIFPDNRARQRPTVQGSIVVFAPSGAPVAVLDGTVLTRLRTGAASALASRYLSRRDSSQLVIVGTGSLAPAMAVAHCAVRPIKRVIVWGRRLDRAAVTASTIRSQLAPEIELLVPRSLEEAVRSADIVCCCTSSTEPIVRGAWLKPGTHVDLVGAFKPSMRESDDAVVLRSRIFVDTFKGALHEGGDVVDPLNRGLISHDRIQGELADLASARVVGRTCNAEITLFKSVGTAIEDLAAAHCVVAAANKGARARVRCAAGVAQ
jgi:alanine dehydrogenase